MKYEKKSVGFITLQAKIRGFEIASKAIRNEAGNVSGASKCLLNLKKRDVGQWCRHHLIALALIRDVPYHTIEPRCHEGNEPNANTILKIVEDHVPFKNFDNRYRKWTIDDIKTRLTRDVK